MVRALALYQSAGRINRGYRALIFMSRLIILYSTLSLLGIGENADQVGAALQAPSERSVDQAGNWSPSDRRTLEQVLARRAAHGLDRVDFLRGDSAADYRRAALEYGRALATGIVNPAKLHDVYTIARPDAEIQAGLTQALQTGTLGAWLDGLAPQDEAYRALSAAYLNARDEEARSVGDRLSPSLSLDVGDSDAGVPLLVAQLIDDGYLQNPIEGPIYTGRMAAAVTALQRDYGVTADGIVGPDTLAILNLRPGDHARALAVALERRRWLKRSPPATRIDVNIASAKLSYYRDGVLVDERRVIVGKPGTETPALASPIYRLVANPTWTIPKSIQRGELAGVSRAYLKSRNMFRRGGWIVQRSGSGNALGVVKFDMKNRHAIYLHDTSARHLFARSQLHLSHGCIRVEDAEGFARMLAKQGEWLTPGATRAPANDNPSFPYRAKSRFVCCITTCRLVPTVRPSSAPIPMTGTRRSPKHWGIRAVR